MKSYRSILIATALLACSGFANAALPDSDDLQTSESIALADAAFNDPAPGFGAIEIRQRPSIDHSTFEVMVIEVSAPHDGSVAEPAIEITSPRVAIVRSAPPADDGPASAAHAAFVDAFADADLLPTRYRSASS